MDYMDVWAVLDVVESGRCAGGSSRICHLLDRLWGCIVELLWSGFVAAHNGSCSSGMDGASWKWPERKGRSGSLCSSRRFALRWRFIPPPPPPSPFPCPADLDDTGLFRLISDFRGIGRGLFHFFSLLAKRGKIVIVWDLFPLRLFVLRKFEHQLPKKHCTRF